MERGLRLPIGYRFRPTDEELVVHYLKPQVFCLPLPALVIPHFPVFLTHPSTLPGDMNEKRYFFSQKVGNSSEGRKRWRVEDGSGYWKPIGKGKQIVASVNNQIVGVRNTLVFYQGNTKTQWVMHEFSLVHKFQVSDEVEFGKWVVYRLFQRKTRLGRRRKHGGIVLNARKTQTFDANANGNGTSSSPSFIDYWKEEISSDVEGGPPQPCSPCSSGMTTLDDVNFF